MLMDGSNIVGITAISYPCFGVLTNIVYEEDITTCVTIGDIPLCTNVKCELLLVFTIANFIICTLKP